MLIEVVKVRTLQHQVIVFMLVAKNYSTSWLDADALIRSQYDNV